jgi:hypothetical protein
MLKTQTNTFDKSVLNQKYLNHLFLMNFMHKMFCRDLFKFLTKVLLLYKYIYKLIYKMRTIRQKLNCFIDFSNEKSFTKINDFFKFNSVYVYFKFFYKLPQKNIKHLVHNSKRDF